MKVDSKARNGSKYTIEKSRIVVKYLLQGESIKYSAQRVGVSPSTLYRWSRKYKKFGRSFSRIQSMRKSKRAVFCRIMKRKSRERSLSFELI